MISTSTILIEYEIFDPEKGTTEVFILKLWPVYCVPGMQIYLLFTRQIIQFSLRVENNKSGSTFHNKFDNTVLLATSNIWANV